WCFWRPPCWLRLTPAGLLSLPPTGRSSLGSAPRAGPTSGQIARIWRGSPPSVPHGTTSRKRKPMPRPPTGASVTENVRLLRKCALFSILDEQGANTLASQCHHRLFERGDRIVRFGDAAQNMLILVTGRARVSRPTLPGKEIILADLEPGEIIGEIAVLDGKE